MILDYELELSSKQAITADAGSTNYYDAKADKDLGIGEPIQVAARVTEAFNNATSVEVQIQGGDAVDAGGVPTFADAVVISRKSFLLAELNTAGRALPGIPPIPQGTSFRFYRAFYDVTGIAPTTGKISLWLVPGTDTKPANAGVKF